MATAVPAVVDVPQQVADWLVTYGVLRHGQSVMTAKGEQVRQVTGAEWSTVQNGFSVGKVLSDHFAKHGHAGVVPTLLEGTTLQVRLSNWNALTPCLAKLGLILTADEKTLIVGGDTEELVGQLYELRTRMGLGSASINHRAALAIKEDADDAAAEEAESNKWELRRSTMLQIASLYSIVVACLLSVFVAQSCQSDKPTCTVPSYSLNGTMIQSCAYTKVACSAKQNLRQVTSFGHVVTGFNFASLAVFLIAQLVFHAREKWCIEAFSQDADLPVENLPEELALYPAFKRKLYLWNVSAMVLASFLGALMFTNFILSAILLFGKRRIAGYATVIGVISNTGLVAVKISNWFLTVRRSMRTDSAYLLFAMENMNLNTVDAQFKFDPAYYTPRADA